MDPENNIFIMTVPKNQQAATLQFSAIPAHRRTYRNEKVRNMIKKQSTQAKPVCMDSTAMKHRADLMASTRADTPKARIISSL
mmetsp:Transcript_6638/g.8681  ORF Transcript_6638/g.8681 Transcript_6638/m.8681 type:complete len:83 (-) Transcript_6638:974-1222(-)